MSCSCNIESKFVRLLLGMFWLLLETVLFTCVCVFAVLSIAFFGALGVIVEGRAECASLGNHSTLDAFDVVIEYDRMFAGWMKLLSTHDG